MKKYLPLILCGLSLLGCQEKNRNLTINNYINSSNNNFINLEERTEADNTLINFPDKIPGAKSFCLF